MDLADFLELTGLTLTEAQEEQYESMMEKAQSRLQRILGWELSSSDNYEEAGKQLSTTFLINQKTLNLDNLVEPDQVTNTWRLYPYYDVNTNLRIDPCTAVYNAKLVLPLKGDDTKFVTIFDMVNWIPLVGKSSGRNNYITYIKKTADTPPQTQWDTNVPMLAVDAEWIKGNYPSDLQEILADLIVYNYQNKTSLQSDAGRVLKSYSESVDGHSISKAYADTAASGSIKAGDPLSDNDVLSVVREYIGPWSPLYKERRIY